MVDTLKKYDAKMQNISAENSPDLPVEHEIKLVDDVPVSLPPRRLPQSQRDIIAEQIEKLKEKGFVENSLSPYGAPNYTCGKERWFVTFMY